MPKEQTTVMMDTELRDRVDRRLLEHELDTDVEVSRSSVIHALVELWEDREDAEINPEVRAALGLISADVRDGQFVVAFGDRGTRNSGSVVAPASDEPNVDEAAASDGSIESLDITGEGLALDRRREAVAAAVAHIEDVGRATKSELLETYDFEAMGYQTAESAWKNCVQPALRQLDDVEASGSSGIWMPSADS